MGHIQIFGEELRRLLVKGDDEAIIKWAKEKVLESYRNGLQTGKVESGKGATRKTKNFARGK